MRVPALLAAMMLGGCIPAGLGTAPEPAAPEPPPVATPPVQVEPVTRDVRDEEQVEALPAPRPAWEARPVAPDALIVPASTYVVRRGDGLSRIALATGAGAEAIARANALRPPYALRVGQRLLIPAGRYHLVRPGQSGIAIARAYGVEWSRIVAANDLTEPYQLRAGQRIDIPFPPTGRSTAERAAAFRLDIDDIITGGEPALGSNQAPVAPARSPSRVVPATTAVAAPPTLRAGFAWPVDGRVVARFGPGRSGERLNGIKIAVPTDTPIRATADGTVAYAGDAVAGLGGVVILRHGGGWISVYGHASKLLVRRGQAVKRGEPLALSGETGSADRPEVHFELRRGRTPVDPLGQLPAT